SWGSTYGAIRSAVERCHNKGMKVSQVHLRNIWPLPSDLKDVLSKFDKVVLPELNRGQLNRLIRAEYLIDTISLPKIQGKPYGGAELFAHFQKILNA
ncbi:MAG TPA: 2-oxoglutarate ferredoxin oxidoreductase subunit alpha, partial [Planctomycetes bacterium]|nr:2-oxoglutarate ferredoxin oxidoreductase subunit alpha [Planctomycetota bacterium]